MLFRIIAVVFVIPFWLALGLVTAAWLWPPQVREFLSTLIFGDKASDALLLSDLAPSPPYGPAEL
jgi:hypothetical protein